MTTVKTSFSNNKKVVIAASVIALAAIIALSVAIPLSMKTKDYTNQAIKILETYPLIDGLVNLINKIKNKRLNFIFRHNDLSWMIYSNFKNQFEKLEFNDTRKYNLSGTRGVSHTDLERLKKGHVGKWWYFNYL